MLNAHIQFFTKIPLKFIQCNIKKQYGISRRFYIIYILIDRYRTRENISMITIGKILEICNLKLTCDKPKAFDEIIDILNFMRSAKMISISQDVSNIGYNNPIEINILPEFDPEEDFTTITFNQFDRIMFSALEKSQQIENTLLMFLYVNSFIWKRPRDANGKETIPFPEKSPEVFFQSINNISKKTGMSKKTVSQCLDALSQSSVLCKNKAPNLFGNNDKTQSYIYAIFKLGCEKEIEWAVKKLGKA